MSNPDQASANHNGGKKIIFRPIHKMAKNLPKIEQIRNKVRESKTVRIPVGKKSSPLEEKFKDVKPVAESYIFETQTNSIREFLNQTHPDVRKLIDNSKINKIVARTHEIEVTTDNKLRIIIATVSRFERRITITQKRRVIFDEKSKLSFKEVQA